MPAPASKHGRPSKGQKVTVAERRKLLVQYRIDGRSFEEIWRELGYSSRSAATTDFRRTLEQAVAELHASVEVYRELELQRLDAELARLTKLYDRVQSIADGSDDGTFLAATDRLLRIDENRRKVAERRAKFLGLDAPVRAEVRTIDAYDAEIADLNKQLAALESEDRAAGDPEEAES